MPEYEISLTVKEAGVPVVTVDIRCADIQKAIALLDTIRSVQANVVVEQ